MLQPRKSRRKRPIRDKPRGTRPGAKVLKAQDPLSILGSGEQIRHYICGGDLTAGIVTAMAIRKH